MNTTRRHFLRSSSATIALPFLGSLGFRPFARAAEPAPPKRIVFLGMGYGVTADRWYPSLDSMGMDYELPELLSPLAKHKKDFTLFQNLMHKYSGDGHSGSTFWLTGANRYGVPGQNFHNTISVDQVAAAVLGEQTRFSSVQLAARQPTASGADGHGPGQSLAWSPSGKPMAALDTPVAAFHRLFSNDNTPLAERQQRLREQHSVLDTILADARAISRRINQSDNEKLDEYLQSIRDIEKRLAKEEKWLDVDKKLPANPPAEPGANLTGYQEMEIMYDLMLAAMQVDACRVFTYRMPVTSLIMSLGATMSAHNMSHYSEGERRVVSQKRDQANARLLARFIDKLKAAKETDDTRLFDHCTVTLGSNLSSVHNLTNCPTLVAGGGAGFKHGRHLVMADKKTPLCNLWLSILRGSGLPAKSFGDSTGVLEELFAG